MKIFAILFISFLSWPPVSGQTPNSKLIISHLTGDFYVYTTFGSYKGNQVPSNSMYLVTSKGVVLSIIPGHLDWNNNTSLTHTLNLIQQYEEKK